MTTTTAKPSLFRDIAVAVVLIALAVLLEVAIEHTRFARELAFSSYRFLQGSFISDRAPIVIVDISDLETSPATPRRTLQELLISIARHKPKAIGVDIDFAPDEQGYVDSHDPEFLDLCLRLQSESSVPIFLGVARTTGTVAPAWLGAPKYQSMAATILIPNDTRKFLYAARAKTDQVELRSLSAALAQAYGTARQRGRIAEQFERAGLIESLSRRNVHQIAFDEFLVDYSAIESFHTIRTISPDFVGNPAMEQAFKGNLVIVGDVANARDMFAVAGREKAYPGVTLHASAATTLIEGSLYEVTHRGRIVFTIALLLAVFAPVIAVRVWARAKNKEISFTTRLQGTLIVIYTVVAVLGAGLVVRFTHIIWDGFFLAFFGLAFHGPIEDFLHSMTGLLKRPKGAVLLMAMLVLATTARAETPVGYIEDLRGPVFLKPADGTRTVQLVAPADLVRRLHAGDRLRCGTGGSARLLIGRHTQKLASSTDWFVVPQWSEPVSAEVRAALAQLFSVGGRSKGSLDLSRPLRIFAPATESRIAPATFILRWTPGPDDCPIAISIDDARGKLVWRQTDIDTHLGELDSEAMRKALVEKEGPFELKLADECENETIVSFDVLASEDTALMRSDLQAWQESSPDPLLSHLGRAAIFARYDLFVEVAEEYEAALVLIPASSELLARAIEAHDRTGNVARKRELTAILPRP